MNALTARPAAQGGTAGPLRQVLRLVGLHLRRKGALAGMVVADGVILALYLLLVALGASRAANKLGPVLLMVVALVTWCSVVGALQTINRQHGAPLVPGQHGRLLAVLFGAWLLVMAFIVALWAGGIVSRPAWLVVIAITLVLSALAIRWPWLWVLPWVLSAGGPAVLGEQGWRVPSALELLLAAAEHAPGTTVGATLVIAALLLPVALPARDGALARPDAKALDPSRAPWPLRWWRRIVRAFTWPYRIALARASRRPQGDAVARALYVFGPGQHWTASATAAAGVGGAALIAVAVLFALGVLPARLDPRTFYGASLGLMGFALGPMFDLAKAMARTQGEQALLVLAPGLPAGRGLNRPLAARLLGWQLAVWAFASAVALALAGGWRAPGALPVAAVFGTLPFCLHPLRDWSRPRPAYESGMWVALAMLALASALWAAQARLGVPVAGVAAGSVLVTGVAGALLWRGLGRRAPAWPAARMAG